MRCASPFAIGLLVISLAGCSSTVGSRFGAGPRSRSIAVVGDRPMPAASGQPGGQVAAEVAEPEPRRSPKTRISGRVFDEDGQPAVGVTVRLADGAAKGGRDIRATTDRSGGFTLNGLRPGSTYDLVAEADEGGENRTGRAEARTAETGVEISLSRADEGTASSSRPGRTKRARPISQRSEEEDPPAEEAAPAVNREDLPSKGEADESEEDRRPVHPRLSTPEPTSSWRKASASKSADASEDEPEASGDEDRNPLPPALDRKKPAAELDPAAGEPEDRPAPRRKGSAKRPAPREDSGSFSTTPEPSAAADLPPANPSKGAAGQVAASEPPPLPPLGPGESASSPTTEVAGGPPPDNELDPDRLAKAGAVAVLARSDAPPLEPPPSTNPPPPAALAFPPPSPASTPAAPSTPPASRPVFASTGGPENIAPTSPTGEEYNPFLLTSAPASVPSQTPLSSEVEPAPSNPPAPESPKPEPAPPRKTWGEVSVSDRPAPSAEPTRTPTSLMKRLRGGPERRDSVIALCNYDAKLPKLIDFQLPDLEGKPVRFQDLDADFVLLDFWGTWWDPCLEAIPHLVELQKLYGPRRLRVVGIACEKVPPELRRGRVADTARRLGINYAVLLSGLDGKPCPVQRAFQIQSYPTTILVDRSGRVLWRNSGATPATRDRLDRVLAGLSRSETVRR